MTSNINQNFENLFKRALAKACTREEIPCKEKHVRNIVINTFNCVSKINFYVSFDHVVKIVHPVVRFKAFLILHLVLREGDYHNSILKFTGKTLLKMQPFNHLNLLYSELCQYYYEMMVKQVEYLSKMIFLRPDYTLKDEREGIPFRSIDAGIKFLTDTITQFKLHHRLGFQILQNVKDRGAFPSAVPGNQCQLRAVIPIIKDMEDIFRLIVHTVVKLAKSCSTTQINEIIETLFTPVFSRYKDYIEDMESFDYVTERYTLPEVPENYSFISKGKSRESLSSAVEESPDSKSFSLDLIDLNQSVSSTSDLNQFDSILFESNTTPPENKMYSGKDSNIFLSAPLTSSQIISSTESLGSDIETIKKLEMRVDELAEKLKKTEIKYTTETEQKISELMKTNYELRNKLDKERQKAEEKDDYARKFEAIRSLYVDLRQKYKILSEHNSEQSSREDEANLQQIQELNEKMILLKNTLVEKDHCIDNLHSDITELKHKMSEIENRGQDKEEIAKFRNYIEEHVSSSTKFFDQLDLPSDQPKAALTGVLENAINRLNYIGFQILGEDNKNQAVSAFMAATDQYLPLIISHGKLYLDKCYDKELDEEIKNLKTVYLKSLQEISENEDHVKIEDLLSRVASVSNSIMSLVQSLPNTDATLTNVADLDYEQKVNQLLQVVDQVYMSCSDSRKNSPLPEQQTRYTPIEENVYDNVCAMLAQVKIIAECSKRLQQEILLDNGKKTKTEITEFYKKNSAWISGMCGFTENIVPEVKDFIATMRGFIKGEILVEELTVASNNVNSILVRLILTSKLKAKVDSENLMELRDETKKLREMIKEQVDRLKLQVSKSQIDEMDLSKLNRTKIMALERQCQIHIIELENDLEKARIKLGKIRASEYTEQKN